MFDPLTCSSVNALAPQFRMAWDVARVAVKPVARLSQRRPAWPQRAMPLKAQMSWRDTIRLILLAVLIAALGTAALKILVDQLS
jgi:hypothetical protein